jgi:DnaJ-class molecular chaperone
MRSFRDKYHTDALTSITLTLQECEECPNVKLVRETVQLSFEISPGMDTGTVITLVEEGEPDPDGDAGDLNIVLVTDVPRDSALRRKGNDLFLTLGISLKQALAGFEAEWEHLDAHKVRHVPLETCASCCMVELAQRSELTWSTALRLCSK